MEFQTIKQQFLLYTRGVGGALALVQHSGGGALARPCSGACWLLALPAAQAATLCGRHAHLRSLAGGAGAAWVSTLCLRSHNAVAPGNKQLLEQTRAQAPCTRCSHAGGRRPRPRPAVSEGLRFIRAAATATHFRLLASASRRLVGSTVLLLIC